MESTVIKEHHSTADIAQELNATVSRLSQIGTDNKDLTALCPRGLPSLTKVKEAMDILWKLMFPELFFERTTITSKMDYRIGTAIERLFELLEQEIEIGLACPLNSHKNTVSDQPGSHQLAVKIISSLPELKRLLYTDVHAIMRKDPAAGNEVEIILCYPSVKAMLHYRFAHLLFTLHVPYLPRIISEMAHS